MKKVLFSITAIFLVFVSSAQAPDGLFVKANNLYKQANYEAAIEQYKLIEELQMESADLYFNLGNSYYKLGEVAPTIYYYEKALKLQPTHKDAKANLVFAKRMALDVIEVLPQNIFEKAGENTVKKFSYNTWAVIAVIFSFIAAILFFLYHFSNTSRKKLIYFNGCILIALLMGLSVFFAFKAYDYEINTISAIVFQQTVEVRNGPTLNSEIIFQLHEGTKVQVLDEVDDWQKIKLADGKTGWMIAENLKEI